LDTLFSTGNLAADPHAGPARFPTIVNADTGLIARFMHRSAESAAFCRRPDSSNDGKTGDGGRRMLIQILE
jgi:hypothetical protein